MPRRLVLIGLPAALALIAGVIGVLPSAAAATYSATGTASLPSPVGFGATDSEFITTCPDAGAAQGVDGHVFSLPADVAVAGATVTLTADSGGPTDVSAYLYDDACTFLDSVSSDATLTYVLKATDRHLSVFTRVLPETTFSLTVTPPVTVDPTVSASTSATATATATSTATSAPTGLRQRTVYPAIPNDPMYAEPAPILGPVALSPGGQWGMQKIRAAQAWQRPFATGAGVQVGVLDSGLDLGHPDFACQGKVRVAAGATQVSAPGDGQPTDVDGHGTHVAGIVGACTNNGTGVVGVAPDATVVPFRVLGPTGGTQGDLVSAIRAATAAGVHVINMSLGFGIAPGGVVTIPGSGSAVALAGQFADVDAAIADAVAAGVVVVAAAGNETTPLCGYPALSDGVVCVGSTDRRDAPAWYGNFPVKADGGVPTAGSALTAPGGSGQVFCDVNNENVLSTYARNLDTCDESGENDPAWKGYRGIDGTSMASPHVAGVAALVYDRLGAVRSPANAAKVIAAMEDGAVDLGAPGYDPVFGSGRVDALGAVNAVTAVVDPTTSPSPTVTATTSASPTGTATTSASPTPTVKSTTLDLTAPASVQRTDALTVSAVLTSEGSPLASRSVRLAVTGQATTDLVTDASGRVSWTLPATFDVGSYEVKATYAGTATELASGDHQPLDVLLEDTAATLALVDRNAKDGLTARVSDADTSSSGVAGITVTFWADGVQDGTATTGPDGVATYTPSKKADKAKSYEVRFAGDSSWRGVRETLAV